MSFEGQGQGRARNDEVVFRGESNRWQGSLESKPEIETIDGSELTPGYEGYRQFPENQTEVVDAAPERTEAPADSFPELITEEESVVAEVDAEVSAEEVEASVETAPEIKATESAEAAIDVRDTTPQLEAERQARLRALEDSVMSPSAAVSEPELAPEKKGWFKRFFGG